MATVMEADCLGVLVDESLGDAPTRAVPTSTRSKWKCGALSAVYRTPTVLELILKNLDLRV